MLSELRELFDYNRWANQRFLTAAQTLSQEEFTRDMRSSFPSIQATLAHLLAAEWIWLQRWLGTSPSGFPADWETGTAAALSERWRLFSREQEAFVASLSETRVLETVSYRNTAGTAFSNRLSEMLRHVVNHSTYHRGQTATMFRQLGQPVPVSDLIVFYRERT